MRIIEQANDGLIDIEAVASRLGQTERFVRRLVEENRIEFFKIGKRVMFRPEDVTAWIASKHVPQRHFD
jgi:excisionase family DNA binding protein